jgi:hypothetical protein
MHRQRIPNDHHDYDAGADHHVDHRRDDDHDQHDDDGGRDDHDDHDDHDTDDSGRHVSPQGCDLQLRCAVLLGPMQYRRREMHRQRIPNDHHDYDAGDDHHVDHRRDDDHDNHRRQHHHLDHRRDQHHEHHAALLRLK